MPDVLKQKMFGLPRWAWVLILVAAIGVGLYLRHRAKVEEEAEGDSEETVAQPAGEYIEPPYEGTSFGGGAGGTEYAGGNELNLEREANKEENQRIRESEKEENELRKYEVEHPPSGETAPSALGPEGSLTFNEPATGGTAETPTETKKKTASTGGGPPAKPKASVKASGVSKSGSKIAIGKAIPIGGGGVGSSPAEAASRGSLPAHPAAVNTGNKCVNGGVGGHSAPRGYHLFCQGGYIWRAPNS